MAPKGESGLDILRFLFSTKALNTGIVPVSRELKLVEEAPAPYTVSGAPAPVHVMVAEPDAVAGVEDDVALDAVAAKRRQLASMDPLQTPQNPLLGQLSRSRTPSLAWKQRCTGLRGCGRDDEISG